MSDKTDQRAIDAEHIERQRLWSLGTFGPATRTKGVVEHMRRELDEVEQDPRDVFEWADLIILAIDGAWRHGHEPQQIIDAVLEKQARNEARTWPDWRNRSEDEPIEHDRSGDAADRAAGIVRVDTRDEALVERLKHVAGRAAAREFLAALREES